MENSESFEKMMNNFKKILKPGSVRLRYVAEEITRK